MKILILSLLPILLIGCGNDIMDRLELEQRKLNNRIFDLEAQQDLIRSDVSDLNFIKNKTFDKGYTKKDINKVCKFYGDKQGLKFEEIFIDSYIFNDKIYTHYNCIYNKGVIKINKAIDFEKRYKKMQKNKRKCKRKCRGNK